jgi:aminomethyltransferase
MTDEVAGLSEQRAKTHLYEFHANTGKLTAFAGFAMPIGYKGIIPEHLAVRNAVGIFDVTHMGRVLITGPEAEAYLNFVTTNDASALEPLDAQYSLMCNDQGGIKDDFVVSRQEHTRFFMVYNAANRTKNYQWLLQHAPRFNVRIEDISDSVAMFAVQGPRAQDTLQKVVAEDLAKVQRFKCTWVTLANLKAFISRTGYTGEDGFEVFIWDTSTAKPEKAMKAWTAILEAGKEFNIEPCGLGARDTLRLEAGLCLYGNDINESTTPLEARLSFVVKLKKAEFIGRAALLKRKTEGITKKRVGLRMLEAGIPRPKHELLKDDVKVGQVTSGTYSPLLKQGIAQAYVRADHAGEGTELTVKIRDRSAQAQIVKFPFYDPDRYGSRRRQ